MSIFSKSGAWDRDTGERKAQAKVSKAQFDDSRFQLFVQNTGFFKWKSGFSEVVNEEQHVHEEREWNKDTVAYAKQIITLANTLLGWSLVEGCEVLNCVLYPEVLQMTAEVFACAHISENVIFAAWVPWQAIL